MPATVQIVEKNGVPGTATDKTSGSVRFKNADNATVDNLNPMVKPPSGTDFSFEKYFRLNVTVAPQTQISNIVAYSDGANGLGTGVQLLAKAQAAYATPTEPSATTGFTDFSTFTSGAPLSLGAGPFTGTGQIGDHLVMLLTVASTATQGVTPTESITFAFDEI